MKAREVLLECVLKMLFWLPSELITFAVICKSWWIQTTKGEEERASWAYGVKTRIENDDACQNVIQSVKSHEFNKRSIIETRYAKMYLTFEKLGFVDFT